MFASLVNYYKVNEIEKSNLNNENSHKMNRSDVFSPSTVASLRRQPLQEVSLDLLRKQQAVTRVQSKNCAAAEIVTADAISEKLIAEQEKYRANEIINSLKKKINRSEKELKLTKEKIITLEQSCSKLQHVANNKDPREYFDNNLQLDLDNEVNRNSSSIYTNIETECKTIRTQIDGMLSLTDEQSQIIYEAKQSFEKIIENLQNDFTNQIQLVEENCKIYGAELQTVKEKFLQSNFQNTELIKQVSNLRHQSSNDEAKIKMLETILHEIFKYKKCRKTNKTFNRKRFKIKSGQVRPKSSGNFLRNLNNQLSNIQQYLLALASENLALNQENVNLRTTLCSKEELLDIADATSKNLIATIEMNKQEDQRLLDRINSLEEELKILVKNSPKHRVLRTIDHSEIILSAYDAANRDLILDNVDINS